MLESVQTSARQRFGRRVSTLRQKQGWSQEQLSERSNVGVQHISGIENGRVEACLDLIEKLAAGFGISIAELMTGV